MKKAMRSLEAILLPYMYRHNVEIRKVTRLLHDYFGLSAFGYHKISANGEYVGLTDAPDLAAYCFEHNLHKDCPYLRHPDAFKDCLVFNDHLITPRDSSPLLTIGSIQYDIHNTVAMIKKSHDCVEMIYLVAKAGNKNLSNLAGNHKGLLNRFLDYFKAELKAILQQIKEESINLAELYPDTFYSQSPVLYISDLSWRLDFLKALGLEKICEQAALLSPREKECLCLLLQGKTAKETAANMELSTRTIEAYLERSKTKLGCIHKADLFAYTQVLQSLNLLH